jgi:hypothetical protein
VQPWSDIVSSTALATSSHLHLHVVDAEASRGLAPVEQYVCRLLVELPGQGRSEGDGDSVHRTGNCVVDATTQAACLHLAAQTWLDELQLSPLAPLQACPSLCYHAPASYLGHRARFVCLFVSLPVGGTHGLICWLRCVSHFFAVLCSCATRARGSFVNSRCKSLLG